MSERIVRIRIDGRAVDELVRDLVAVEVREVSDGMSSFAMQLGIRLKTNGTWTHLDPGEDEDAPYIALWQRITIEAGFEGNADVLIDGYVAGLAPTIEPKESDSYLLVWGYDAAYALDQDERIVAWADRAYSDVATEIFQNHGLQPVVESSQVQHAEEDYLLVQRGSDWSFLSVLAQRLGYELRVRGGEGLFRPPRLDLSPQRDIAFHFGAAGTNGLTFEGRVVGSGTTVLSSQRIEPYENRIEPIEVERSPLRPLGADDASAAKDGREVAGEGRRLFADQPVIDVQELEARVTGMRRIEDWFVDGEGELDGMLYGQALKAGAPVVLKGLGRRWSGRWYVTEVLHHITHREYRQRFRVVRNGLGPLGDERYTLVAAAEEERIQRQGGDEEVSTRRTGRSVSS